MSDSIIDYEVRGNVAVITINRPEARNAVNGAVAQGLEAAVDRMEADDEIWVGVLTHEGPVFCAGADLKAINSGEGAQLNTATGGFGGIVAKARTKPLIAACNGPAYAGGCEIVLACDLLVASNEAKFGVPEVKRNLVAAAGALFRLPVALPRNVAMEMLMTGDPIDALKQVGHLVRSIHCKDATWAAEGLRGTEWGAEVALGEGDVGMETYLQTLNAIGYTGPLTIEREIAHDRERQKADIGHAVELLNRLKQQSG